MFSYLLNTHCQVNWKLHSQLNTGSQTAVRLASFPKLIQFQLNLLGSSKNKTDPDNEAHYHKAC